MAAAQPVDHRYNSGFRTTPGPIQCHARLGNVYVVHGTRKFLERVSAPPGAEVRHPTTVLGDWYATVLFWKPQAALFLNESTLLPVLLPFAPADTVIDRFPAALATVLRRHGVGEPFIEAECAAMADHRVAKTTNRSAVGMLTEFAFLGGAYAESEDVVDLVELSLWLARTPCGPLESGQGSPDRELAAHIARQRG